MPGFTGPASYNRRLALRQNALDRLCRACNRKAALGVWHHVRRRAHRWGDLTVIVSYRECRYCHATDAYTNNGSGRWTVAPDATRQPGP